MRTKKLTDYNYSPTNPASEDAIRLQIDDAIQEVYDASSRNGATVNLTGDQTIADIKTFSSSPIIPYPTSLTQAATKGYVDGVAISTTVPLGSVTDEYLSDEPNNIKEKVSTLQTDLNLVEADVDSLQIEILNKADTSYVNTQISAVTDGSPKGTYATLGALQSAFPTGTTGIYIVAADGNWYFWNGAAWASGGVYQSSGIADSSVAPPKLDRFYASGFVKSNMLDYAQFLDNKYYDSANGNLVTGNNTTFALPLIKLTIGKTYTLSGGRVFRYAFYDSNKVFTSGGSSSSLPQFVADASKVYIGLSYVNSALNVDMMVEATYLPSSYEKYVTVPEDYKEKSITPISLDRFYAPGKINSNILEFTKKLTNKYYDRNNGALLTGVGTTFAMPLIELESGKTYTGTTTMYSYAFFNENKVRTSGGENLSYPFTADSNKKYIGLTYYNAAENAAMLVEGSTLPSTYEPYEIVPISLGNKVVMIKDLNDEVLDIIQGANSTIITVAKNGGNYLTIQEAVDAAQDSALTPVTIMVYPGVYNETVSVKNRYISLIGIDREKTIVLTETGDYLEPPLEAGGGELYFKNLTFKATHDNPKESYSSTTRAYGAHVDFEGEGTTIFENCNIISYQSAALGSGTFPNQKIIFKNCNFEFYDDGGFTPVESRFGCIFAHSYSFANTDPQNYEFYNCRVYSENYNAMRLRIIGSDFKCLFVDTFICGTVRSISKNDGSSAIINQDSFGNNLSVLNTAII